MSSTISSGVLSSFRAAQFLAAGRSLKIANAGKPDYADKFGRLRQHWHKHMSFFTFFSRWRKRRRTATVVLYSRRGCHLCDDAWEMLQRYRGSYGFRLEAVDVDGDPELAARHGDWVPVVMVNGKVRFRGRVNEVLLKRLLDTSN